MPNDRWARLGDAAAVAGTDRTKVLNRLAAWYAREPGAKIPKRPEVIFAFRLAGDDTADWLGQPDAIARYKTDTLIPTQGNYADRELEMRYGDVADETPPAMRAYITLGGTDRVYPTALVHELLFGAE